MEKEEQKWEQEEVEEEQQEEETNLQARKSRPVNETKRTESSIVTENNNGTSESNGHEVQSTVTADGTQDFESTLENGEKKDELDRVVGDEGEITNGMQKSDNLVFFDKDEVDELEKTNGHNKLEILSQESAVLHNSTSAVNGGSEKHLDGDSLSYSNHQHNGIREKDGLPNSDIQSSGEIESEEVYVIPGDELEVTEVDVERVLQKQTTHDLYCPNCSSCITRRVILCKRKRRIRLSAQDIKRNKPKAVADDAGASQVSSTVIHGTDYVGIDNTPLLATHDTDHDREPELFRCLSCFSFFFPTGNGFKLFRIFEGKKEKVIVQDEHVPSIKKNWFASILAFNTQETTVARGSKYREAQPPAQASDVPLPGKGHTVKTKVLVGAGADKTEEKIGKHTVITIDTWQVGSSQTGQNNVNPDETESALHAALTVADIERTEVRNESEIEVVKSIVYGGLAEAITSLSVVSSAAGGGAATLNILALGVASLIGGFFVICQNLWELRNECIEQPNYNHVTPVIEQRDRYKELLGRKEHFTLHAIVSVLSYIIFGLVAPVTYGFSFHKSDDKEFKLIVVAAASLLCIFVLAVGRAYVRRPPKPYIKSVVTYVIMGFMASGVSYVAGVLVERILAKLGLFHSSSSANLLLPQMESVPSYSGWTSY